MVRLVSLILMLLGLALGQSPFLSYENTMGYIVLKRGNKFLYYLVLKEKRGVVLKRVSKEVIEDIKRGLGE